jgi:hypothetical protein
MLESYRITDMQKREIREMRIIQWK